MGIVPVGSLENHIYGDCIQRNLVRKDSSSSNRPKHLRGGDPAASAGIGTTRCTMTAVVRSCLCTFLGIVAISLAVLIYLVIVSYVIYLRQAITGSEPSFLTIAILSLVGNILGSLAGGNSVGRLVQTNPSLHAAAASAIFVLFQLRTMHLFEGIPSWFAAITLIPLVPCCAYSARRTAPWRTSSSTPSPASAASAAAQADRMPAAASDGGSALEETVALWPSPAPRK